MQEEERERRDNYCPDVSEVKTEGIEVDKATMFMLRSIGMEKIPGVVVRNEEKEIRAKPPTRKNIKPRK